MFYILFEDQYSVAKIWIHTGLLGICSQPLPGISAQGETQTLRSAWTIFVGNH